MIDVSKLLDELGIEHKNAGDDYKCKCWHHPEKQPSMYINVTGGFYHCFSCHSKGNLFTLVWDHLQIGGLEAVEYLNQFDNGGFTDEEMREYLVNCIGNRNLNIDNKVDVAEITLPDHEPITDSSYLISRGITPRDMIAWGMGSITGYPYNDWIIIPVYFNNVIRNYFLRSPNSNRKLYGKYDISDIIFGLDSATNLTKPLCLAEGIFDMIFLRRAGMQSGGILSNRLLPGKISNIKKYTEIVIFPDNDENEAGLYVIEDAQQLMRSTRVSVAELPLGINDPGDCWQNLDILKDAYNSRVSIEDFILADRFTNWLLNDRFRKKQIR